MIADEVVEAVRRRFGETFDLEGGIDVVMSRDHVCELHDQPFAIQRELPVTRSSARKKEAGRFR